MLTDSFHLSFTYHTILTRFATESIGWEGHVGCDARLQP